MIDRKDTNPKDAVGVRKWRQFFCVPFAVVCEMGVAMLEGARKYGRNNWRASGAAASIYVDAAIGHIMAWNMGEETDPDSGVSHLTKAMVSLAVLRDAQINGVMVDDRPPSVDLAQLQDHLQEAVDGIFERIPQPQEPWTDARIQQAQKGE